MSSHRPILNNGVEIRKYAELLTNLPKPKRAAVYLRVSSDRQTLESQRVDVLALAKLRGYAVEYSFEEQMSAVKRRPAFDDMLSQAREKRFEAVVVWAIDRFGRTLQKNLRDIWALDDVGVSLLSVKEPWLDTSGPTRGLLLAVFAWVAEQERARLIERMHAFQKTRRAHGEAVGRPPYGWCVGQDGRTLVPEPSEAALVLRVRELKRSGLSSRKIVSVLNADGARNRAGGGFNRTQIVRMLARPEGKPWKETRLPSVDESSPSTTST